MRGILDRAGWYSAALRFRIQQPLARVLADAPAPPPVTAKAVFCLDLHSGSPLLAKNGDYRLPPASTIKLATALILVRTCRDALDELVRVEPDDLHVKGSRVGLRAGDVLSYRALLHAMLMASGNDAAQVAARAIGRQMLAAEDAREGWGAAIAGDPVTRFVTSMNALSAELSLRRTRFVNPSGMPAPGQFSTARDLALLAREAFREPLIREASGTKRCRVDLAGASPRPLELRSTVEMLGELEVDCGKTGTSPGGGASLVLHSRVGGRPVVTVLLASSIVFSNGPLHETDRRYDDARRVLRHLAQSPRPEPA